MASGRADEVDAEAEGFEPSIPCGMPHFKCGGINHYPTPPQYENSSTKNRAGSNRAAGICYTKPMPQKTCTHKDQIRDVHPKDITVCEDCIKTGDTWVNLR